MPGVAQHAIDTCTVLAELSPAGSALFAEATACVVENHHTIIDLERRRDAERTTGGDLFVLFAVMFRYLALLAEHGLPGWTVAYDCDANAVDAYPIASEFSGNNLACADQSAREHRHGGLPRCWHAPAFGGQEDDASSPRGRMKGSAA